MADVVADASVWVSYLLPADPLHARTRAWLGPWLVQRNRLVAPWLLLPEVSGAVARRSGQTVLGHRAVMMLRHSRRVEFHDLDESLAAESAMLAVILGLRGPDATYVAVADRLGLPLVTWDREQLTRAASVIQTRTP